MNDREPELGDGVVTARTVARRRSLAPWTILVIGVASATCVTWLYRRVVREKDEERFENSVQQAYDTISDRLDTYVAILRGAAGLFAARGEVRLEEFRDYVRELEVDKNLPGIQGIGFARRVRREDREGFELQQRQQGRKDFTVRSEADDLDEGFPILYLEPLDRRNLVAIGYDMYGEPVRRTAMEMARDSGEPHATGRLTLVQEIDSEKQAGFLIYLPIYAGTGDPTTIAERRERLVGFVYAPFRAGDLLGGISGSESHPRVHVDVYDGDLPLEANLLHRPREAETQVEYEPRHSDKRRITVGGRNWTLAFSTRPDFEFASGARQVPLLFAAGIWISMLLFWITRTQVLARSEAERNAALWARAEERFATTLASIGDGVIATDQAGRVTFVNPVAERLTGWTIAEAVGKDTGAVFQILDEATRAPLESPVARVLREGRITTLDQRALLVARDGQEIAIDDSAAPIRGRGGMLQGTVLVFRDIRERRAVEAELARHRGRLEDLVAERTRALEETHQRLRFSERMASLGTLSAGLGHDMGNLLLPVRIRLEGLATAGLTPSLRQEIGVIQKCVEYLQRLSNGLRLFALDPDQAALSGETTDLAEWWSDAEPFFKSVLPRGIVLESRLPRDLPAATIARHALTQAVFNLVQNAGDVMRPRGRGRLLVWADVAHVDATDAADADREVVQIGVTDDGPGMSPDVRQRCLEPFFTTKTRGISTGLGLALVHAIVQKAGGTLAIDSEPGRGTTFVLSVRTARRPAAAESGAGGAAPIALLDVADRRIASYTASQLRNAGFEVREGTAAAAQGARLWIGDERQLDAAALRAFLAADARRAALVFGAAVGLAANGQLIVLPRALKPTAIRDAIRELTSRTAGASPVRL